MRSPPNSDLLSALERLGRPRILVLGDLMLDQYCWGNAERVSPEAPVVVLRADQSESRLGGAANVCNMLRGLEAEVVCCGVLGEDAEGQTVVRMLADAGVDVSGALVDSGRPTTVKHRFVGRAANRHAHQILRVDREARQPIGSHLQGNLAAAISRKLSDCAAAIVADYGKGVCTPDLLRILIEMARGDGKPLLVDPHCGGDYRVYQRATVLTPSRREAEFATGYRVARPDDAMVAGEKLCRELALDAVIVTIDSDGLVLVQGADQTHFPTRARAVYDITGAGDVVLAVLGMCLAENLPYEVACRLANIAGGLEVERLGVARVTREDIRSDLELASSRDSSEGGGAMGRVGGGKIVSGKTAARIAAEARRAGHKVVFTNGCFAALHAGHVAYLREARMLGDLLIVAINCTESVRRLKGDRPIIPDADRAAMLAALDFVNHVLVFDEDTPNGLLEAIRPDVLVKGGTTDAVVGREIVEAYGGRVLILAATRGVSTTKLLGSPDSH